MQIQHFSNRIQLKEVIKKERDKSYGLKLNSVNSNNKFDKKGCNRIVLKT